jgi:hypothetical protein
VGPSPESAALLVWAGRSCLRGARLSQLARRAQLERGDYLACVNRLEPLARIGVESSISLVLGEVHRGWFNLGPGLTKAVSLHGLVRSGRQNYERRAALIEFASNGLRRLAAKHSVKHRRIASAIPD